MSSFFIISTITGSYYVGFIKNNYDKYHFFFDELLKIENTYIPRSNIDYIKLNISYNEFVRTCENLGINNQQDYMNALKEYQKE